MTTEGEIAAWEEFKREIRIALDLLIAEEGWVRPPDREKLKMAWAALRFLEHWTALGQPPHPVIVELVKAGMFPDPGP